MGFSVDASKYLHSYEAYRIPDGSTALKAEQDKAYAQQRMESIKKLASDQVKALTVYRNMTKGDMVAETDEKKLMDYDPKLYYAAKMAQILAQKEDAEKHDAEWNAEEEERYWEKIKELGEIGDELGAQFNETFGEFLDKQKDSVVEVSASSVDLSSIKSFYSMGQGLAGAVIDKVL